MFVLKMRVQGRVLYIIHSIASSSFSTYSWLQMNLVWFVLLRAVSVLSFSPFQRRRRRTSKTTCVRVLYGTSTNIKLMLLLVSLLTLAHCSQAHTHTMHTPHTHTHSRLNLLWPRARYNTQIPTPTDDDDEKFIFICADTIFFFFRFFFFWLTKRTQNFFELFQLQIKLPIATGTRGKLNKSSP